MHNIDYTEFISSRKPDLIVEGVSDLLYNNFTVTMWCVNAHEFVYITSVDAKESKPPMMKVKDDKLMVAHYNKEYTVVTGIKGEFILRQAILGFELELEKSLLE